MKSAILRQWLVLRMLPRAPRRIDTGAIESRLRERGIEVHRRTIQRDLLDLAEVFPIVADERAKPYGWRWSDDAEVDGQLPPPRVARVASALEVSLRIQRSALTCVLERIAPRTHTIQSDADLSFLRAVVVVEDSRTTRRLLLGLGDVVEVLAPHALRREIAEGARRVLLRHAG